MNWSAGEPDAALVAAPHQVVQGVPHRFLVPGAGWLAQAAQLPTVEVVAGSQTRALVLRCVAAAPTAEGIRVTDADIYLERVTFIGHGSPQRTASDAGSGSSGAAAAAAPRSDAQCSSTTSRNSSLPVTTSLRPRHLPKSCERACLWPRPGPRTTKASFLEE